MIHFPSFLDDNLHVHDSITDHACTVSLHQLTSRFLFTGMQITVISDRDAYVGRRWLVNTCTWPTEAETNPAQRVGTDVLVVTYYGVDFEWISVCSYKNVQFMTSCGSRRPTGTKFWRRWGSGRRRWRRIWSCTAPSVASRSLFNGRYLTGSVSQREPFV